MKGRLAWNIIQRNGVGSQRVEVKDGVWWGMTREKGTLEALRILDKHGAKGSALRRSKIMLLLAKKSEIR